MNNSLISDNILIQFQYRFQYRKHRLCYDLSTYNSKPLKVTKRLDPSY